MGCGLLWPNHPKVKAIRGPSPAKVGIPDPILPVVNDFARAAITRITCRCPCALGTGMTFAQLEFMKRPASTDKSNSASNPTQASHPEARRKRPSHGAPGAENSEVSSAAKDARTGHDKDGNEQQRKR